VELPLHADICLLAECRRRVFRQADQAAAQTRGVLLDCRTSGRDQPIPRRDQLRSATVPMDKRPRQNYRRGEKRAPSVRFYPLAVAGITLEQPTRSHLAIRPAAAGRAVEAVQPSRCDHRRPAFLLVDRLEARLTWAFLKLHLVPSRCRPLPDFSFTLCTTPKRLRKVRNQECK
jgi:hypothetical protein